MKELLKNTNKSEWLLTGLYKVSIYICWYLFACIFTNYLDSEITDSKLILLVFSLIIVYTVRSFLKILYKKNANTSYYNLKHTIEMHYFNQLKDLNYETIENLDKEELSDRILEVSYNYTKIISDIFEYIIPAAIGLLMIFLQLLDLNKAFGLIAFGFLIIILIYSYNNLHDDEIKVTNYNDLLKDFVSKILVIKKLNVFDFCSKKLDETKENDICILKNNDTINDIKFSNFLFIFISVILISSFFFVKNTITRLGIIIFFIIVILKLQELLYKINPAIKNMLSSSNNRIMLENMLKDQETFKINNKWKKISIKGGVVNYQDTTDDIKIPEFELLKKDHISIMGASGQGKSTVLNILSGIFKLDQGDILYDGNKTNEIVDAMYLSPEVGILNITLRDNLKFMTEITDEELINLINEINLKEWYASLSNGLDEILTDNVDDSIIEKINILRAIISNKDIYFFDEPTNNLDTDSEKKVASMLKKYFKDQTYIIISKKTVLTNLCKKHYFIKNHTLLEKEPLL